MEEKAIEKLENEFKQAGKMSAKGQAVAGFVLNALKEFCRQNSEFAQAVVQCDKTVKECIEYTVKECKNSISDNELYRRAAQFYFPNAEVHVMVTIDLGDNGFSNKQTEQNGESKPNVLGISLDGLLDF